MKHITAITTVVLVAALSVPAFAQLTKEAAIAKAETILNQNCRPDGPRSALSSARSRT